MSKVHKFPFVVAFADTDAEGIVYHARYLEIAERARMNWLKGRFSLADEFVVETVMTDVGAAVVKIEQKFVKNDCVCAIMNLRVAYLGKDMLPKRIPEEFIKDLV